MCTAPDGAGSRLLKLVSSGTIRAQLIYHSTSEGSTTGSGVRMTDPETSNGTVRLTAQ